MEDVAVLIPAHNEAEVIAESLAAITELIPMWNVHVVSDGSTDNTVAIARSAGAKVYQTEHNLGKAGALQDAIARFRLVERFPVVMLLDADTRVEPGYFAAALPLFDDPEVVAVAGCVRTAADRALSLVGQLLVGHRRRIYCIGQRVLKFGQTWRRFNATHIVPGFASLYRTDVLPHIDMNPPGLVIEDFNMTFEVYQKRLGKVAFSLSADRRHPGPGHLPRLRETDQAVGAWFLADRAPPPAPREPVQRDVAAAAAGAGHVKPDLPDPAGATAHPGHAGAVRRGGGLAGLRHGVHAHRGAHEAVDHLLRRACCPIWPSR